jgi:fatty acid desaturase
MIPGRSLDPDVAGSVLPVQVITASGRPTRAFRAQLRRIPDARNALALAAVYAQTIAIVVVAVHFDVWYVWIAAFLLMGRALAQLTALMHEAAHRLLFRNRTLNDFAGRWLLGFPAFRSIDAYRRGHMAHHRDDYTPADTGLSVPLVVAPESQPRKLVTGVAGRAAHKFFFRSLWGTVRSENKQLRARGRAVVATQLLLIAIGIALHHPWVYFILWLGPYLTVWRVINRLRAIAEHGGAERASDGTLLTPMVKQSPLARFLIVPFHVGWHFAHHADPSVPMSQLPRLHTELERAGFVSDTLEFKTYASLWRKLARGASLDVDA